MQALWPHSLTSSATTSLHLLLSSFHKKQIGLSTGRQTTSQIEHEHLLPRCVHQMMGGQESMSEAKPRKPFTEFTVEKGRPKPQVVKSSNTGWGIAQKQETQASSLSAATGARGSSPGHVSGYLGTFPYWLLTLWARRWVRKDKRRNKRWVTVKGKLGRLTLQMLMQDCL